MAAHAKNYCATCAVDLHARLVTNPCDSRPGEYNNSWHCFFSLSSTSFRRCIQNRPPLRNDTFMLASRRRTTGKEEDACDLGRLLKKVVLTVHTKCANFGGEVHKRIVVAMPRSEDHLREDAWSNAERLRASDMRAPPPLLRFESGSDEQDQTTRQNVPYGCGNLAHMQRFLPPPPPTKIHFQIPQASWRTNRYVGRKRSRPSPRRHPRPCRTPHGTETLHGRARLGGLDGCGAARH